MKSVFIRTKKYQDKIKRDPKVPFYFNFYNYLSINNNYSQGLLAFFRSQIEVVDSGLK